MQCHKYAHGACAVSHSLSIRKANAAVIAELERCAAANLFPLAPQIAKKSSGPDFDHLIAVEEIKLRRVADAYEAGIDTLQEYARKKALLQKSIDDLRAQQSAAAAAAAASRMSPGDMHRKVLDALEIIRSPTATEAAKNTALRSVLSHIVYQKSTNQLQLFFSF